MASPTLQEFLGIAHTAVASGMVVPVWEEMVADMETPVSALVKLIDMRPVFLLESAEGGERVGRYSFLGFKPFWELRADGSTVRVSSSKGSFHLDGDPVEVLRRFMPRAASRKWPLPRFFGGAVGYLAYEWVHRLERLPRHAGKPSGWPEAVFVVPELVLIFDHLRYTLTVVVNQQLDRAPEHSYHQALGLIEEVRARLGTSAAVLHQANMSVEPAATGKEIRGIGFVSNFSQSEFCTSVRRAKEYIRAGEVFQVVLSQRLETVTRAQPLQVYRLLRALNPSPYMFYLDLGDRHLVGSSPEMLVRVEEGWVETRPIAGTRPRGRDEDEDRRLEAELLADAKERAEHVMLVDLARNDLGRVCQPGTVQVTDFMRVERYSHVMHIVSAVRGRLRPDLDAFSALASCFPAGTLTGAPKVRAMEIIAELEPSERGPYGGAVGYFSFSGNLDTCITIRTVAMQDGKAVVQAGAGIVADSDPEREYEETVNKARALLLAVQLAEKGVS